MPRIYPLVESMDRNRSNRWTYRVYIWWLVGAGDGGDGGWGLADPAGAAWRARRRV